MAEDSRGNHTTGGIWQIGEDNGFVGSRVKVTWLRAWGGKPVGHVVIGELAATFVVNGRTLIGEVTAQNGFNQYVRKQACPWSRKWIDVEVLSSQERSSEKPPCSFGPPNPAAEELTDSQRSLWKEEHMMREAMYGTPIRRHV